MNINKSSWHFKLLNNFQFKIVRKLRYEEPVTLCEYFWNVVAVVLFSLVWITTIAIFVAGSLFVMSSIFMGLVVFFGASWLPVVEVGGFVHSMYSGGLLIFCLIGVAFIAQTLIDQIKEGKITPEWMKVYKVEAPKKNTKPNILFEYVKAKKNKFCPVVRLED